MGTPRHEYPETRRPNRGPAGRAGYRFGVVKRGRRGRRATETATRARAGDSHQRRAGRYVGTGLGRRCGPDRHPRPAAVGAGRDAQRRRRSHQRLDDPTAAGTGPGDAQRPGLRAARPGERTAARRAGRGGGDGWAAARRIGRAPALKRPRCDDPQIGDRR